MYGTTAPRTKVDHYRKTERMLTKEIEALSARLAGEYRCECGRGPCVPCIESAEFARKLDLVARHNAIVRRSRVREFLEVAID